MITSAVINKVRAIMLQSNDASVAHEMEDALYLEVLQAIATLNDNSQSPEQGLRKASALAFEALKSQEISFARDCS